MVREVTVEYRYTGTFGGISVIYFDDAATNTNITSGVTSFLDYLTTVWNGQVSGDWDGVVRDLDTGTGTLTGLTQLAGVNRVGSLAGISTVAQNASLGIKYLTGGIVAGRLVQGRSFVPYIDRSLSGDSGEPDGVPLPTFSTAARVIWSRPKKEGDPPVITRPGTAHPITGVIGTTGDWATQGSRRRV